MSRQSELDRYDIAGHLREIRRQEGRAERATGADPIDSRIWDTIRLWPSRAGRQQILMTRERPEPLP
jgi:hypothetical protein